MLIPALHPNYATLPRSDRLRELKESSMSRFFRHLWTLIFSVSANNILHSGELDGLEKTFSSDAWQRSINDPFQVGNVALIVTIPMESSLNGGRVPPLKRSHLAPPFDFLNTVQASSFGMVLMGGDVGLNLFNQMLPTKQKRMLKKAKYGSSTVFASQMQLTGSLLSASGHIGLGIFLHAQSVYFGVMIRRWIQKRSEDRVREIISWLTLGMYFASSFIQ